MITRLAALVLLLAPRAMACVGCRTPGDLTMANENPTVLAGIGFSWGVVFLLVFVLTLLAAMVSYIWWTCVQIERGRSS